MTSCGNSEVEHKHVVSCCHIVFYFFLEKAKTEQKEKGMGNKRKKNYTK